MRETPLVAGMASNLAGIQYVGISGVTIACVEAVGQALITREITDAILVSNIGPHPEPGRQQGEHGILLKNQIGDYVAVKAGFTSGYGGEGPGGLGKALRMLESHKIEVGEVIISGEVLQRLNKSGLTEGDVNFIESAPRRHGNIFTYAHGPYARDNGENPWSRLPQLIPFPLLDERLLDLAVSFWSKPTDNLREAFVRLEEAVRERTGIEDHGSSIFRAAFMPGNARLTWPGLKDEERAARATLFEASYRAHRNPRAHRQLEDSLEAQLSEFLLVNHLFRLEKSAEKSSAKGIG